MTDLRERLDRDLADLQPPTGLEPVVLARGRRIRARRRAGRAAGALVATAAAGAVVVSLLGGSGGNVTDPGFADDVPPAPSPGTGARPAGWWDMPARRMVTVLEEALPEGVTVTDSDLFMETETGLRPATGSLMGVLTADTGPGTFQILMYAPDPTEPLPDPVTTTGADGSTDTTPEVAGPTVAQRIKCRGYMTTCEPILDGSGAVIGRASTDTDQGTTYHEVAIAGPDGGAMYFYVADSTGEKPGYEAPSASEPPLTVDELVALAQDTDWTSYVPAP